MEQMLLQQPDAWERGGLPGGDGVLGQGHPHAVRLLSSLAKAVCPRDTEGSLT